MAYTCCNDCGQQETEKWKINGRKNINSTMYVTSMQQYRSGF